MTEPDGYVRLFRTQFRSGGSDWFDGAIFVTEAEAWRHGHDIGEDRFRIVPEYVLQENGRLKI